MSESRIASRYARSLLVMSEKQGITEQVGADMAQLAHLVQKSRSFYLFLHNPVLSSYRKASIFRKLLKEKVQALTLLFLELLARKGREAYMVPIALAFKEQYQAHQGIVPAKLSLVQVVDKAQEKDFCAWAERHTQKKVELEVTTDPTLLGGYVLHLGKQRYDASVRTKLREVKQHLLEK